MSRSVRGDVVDEKIVKACNELMMEQTDRAKLRAQQQTEYRKVSKYYQEAHEQWERKMKTPKKNSINTSLHQDQLSIIFEGEKMSPFLWGQLSQLCYHVHLMTRLESFEKTVHEDYRVIVNWIHESWEEMETESSGMKKEIDEAQQEIKTLKRQQFERLQKLEKQHDQDKQKILAQARRPETQTMTTTPHDNVKGDETEAIEEIPNETTTTTGTEDGDSKEAEQPNEPLVLANPQDVPVESG